MDGTLEEARRWFAEDLRVAAPVVHSEKVIEAFAGVPRERFCGPPPWRIHPRRSGGPPVTLCDERPTALYHDVLVVLDEARGVNVGRPSLWANIFDHLRLAPGESVLQIGAGTGYYTAILAEIVGPEGRVEAIEIDSALAARAGKALAPWPWAKVRHGDGVAPGDGPPADVVVVCAGATHPAPAWLERLSPNGRLLLPLTASGGGGFLLLAERLAAGFAAASLGPCGFVRCEGARRPAEEKRLDDALAALKFRPVPVRSLHRGRPPADAPGLWFAGEDYWLSTEPLPDP